MRGFLEIGLTVWHQSIAALPFAWTEYEFMRTALLGIVIVSPLFALVGTMVINNRMAFFSDVLGHSALTGVAIGVLAGMADPLWAMLGFAAFLALLFNCMKRWTGASSDTILGVLFSATVAFGIVVLSRNGGFNKFTSYLIGDILAVTPGHILILAVFFGIVTGYWLFFGNRLVLVSMNPILAQSRGISSFLLDLSFSLLLAILVILSIQMVGLLIIGALLVVPAAAARTVTRSVRGYTAVAICIGLFSGIVGIIASYYLGTASGATIVLTASGLYCCTAALGFWRMRGR
jgi:zinc transport system permease protein